MIPESGTTIFGAAKRHLPGGMANLVCDAMYAAIREAKGPQVDLTRLYSTGLSSGGHSAFSTSFAFPGSFAACIPVASVNPTNHVPERNAGRYWAIYNSGDKFGARMRDALDELKPVVEAAGGELRISSYSNSGHDAWSTAWSEDAVWDWCFSKSSALAENNEQKTAAASAPASIACSASIPGKEGFEASRGADALNGTWYESAAPAKRDDWWMAEFSEPQFGRIRTGRPDGSGLLKGRVEISSTGGNWTRIANVSSQDGVASFRAPASGVKFIRAIPTAATPETLVIRKVECY